MRAEELWESEGKDWEAYRGDGAGRTGKFVGRPSMADGGRAKRRGAACSHKEEHDDLK
jgi:hypothetical protein